MGWYERSDFFKSLRFFMAGMIISFGRYLAPISCINSALFCIYFKKNWIPKNVEKTTL